MNTHLIQPVLNLVRTQFLGLIAVLLVLTGSAAYAAVAKDSVTSRSIKNGAVKTIDLMDGAVSTQKLALDAVGTAQVSSNALTGSDISESTLGTVPNATTVNGVATTNLMRATVYKKESAVAAGTDLGDGTFTLSVACDPGDLLLSGGPANVSGTSDMVESFSTPGSTVSWTARINKHGLTDSFSVVILCVDQAA